MRRMKEQIEIISLILAAGNSSRLGQPKQLLAWRNQTLIEHTVQRQLALQPGRVVVLLGAHFQQIEPVLKPYAVDIIYHSQWEKGLGNSLAFGIQKIIPYPEWDGVLIVLSDQPLIDLSYLKEMVAEYRKHPEFIVATNYQGKPGVPAMIPKTLANGLINLSGDSGAGKWMQAQSDKVILMPQNTDTSDIDTLEDYQELLKRT